jgi:hypothetical protein
MDKMPYIQAKENKVFVLDQRGGVQRKKDSKNEGRSDYIYENTGSSGTMSRGKL